MNHWRGITFSCVLAFAALASTNAVAAISHLSVNKYTSVAGQPLSLRLNFVAPEKKIYNFRFILHQFGEKEILNKHILSDYLLNVESQNPIIDPDAYIRVYEYKLGYWFSAYRLDLGDNALKEDKKQQITVNTAEFSEPSPLAKQLKQGLLTSTNAPVASTTEGTEQVTKRNITPKITAQLLKNCKIELREDDTLWRVSTRYAKLWQTDVYNVMLALYEANLDAFHQQNIFKLKPSSTFVCPSVELLTRFDNKQQARIAFRTLEVESRK